MPPKQKRPSTHSPSPPKPRPSTGASKATDISPAAAEHSAASVISSLRRLADKKTLAGYSRYGIHAQDPLGVPMNKIQALAKEIKGPAARARKATAAPTSPTARDLHDLAESLWISGVYEARLLAAYLDDPALVTPAQMDRWCKGPRGFENWGDCDTVCFVLFDRVPAALAFRKIAAWSTLKPEFVCRAGLVLLACVALHNKTDATDAQFLSALSLIRRTATDDRNFVKKGASWALRSIGTRSPALHAAAMALATRLAASADPTSKWLGKDVLRQLAKRKPRPTGPRATKAPP